MHLSKISFLIALWSLTAFSLLPPSDVAQPAAVTPIFSNNHYLDSPQPSECLAYEPTVITLKGQISRGVFADANNKKATVWLLNLNSPVCVKGVEGDEIDVDADNIKRMQLVLSTEMYQKYKNLVGKKATVSGTLFHGHTAHHFTDVLLIVSEIK